MSEITKLKLIFFLKFCAEAMFLPFLAIYYKSLGFNAATIGLFLAIPSIIGISLSPVYSIICRNIKVTKLIYSIITILNVVCMFLFFQFKTYTPLLVIVILLNMFQANNFGVLEGFASVCANHNHTDYSRVRVFGSIAYVLGLPISGFITKISNFYLASILTMAFTLASAILCFFLHVDNEEHHEKRNIKKLATNKKYLLFTVFFILFFGTMNVGDDFFGTYMEELKGFTYDTFSYLWSSFIIVECVVIIFLYRFKKKFKFRHLYTLAAFCLVIRYFTIALGAPVPVLIITGLTKGITMGIHAFLWGQFIVHITGKNNATLAIIVETFIVSVYQAVLKITLGHVIDHTSYYVFYLILSYAIVIALIFFIIIFRNDDYVSMAKKKPRQKKNNKNNDDNKTIDNEENENKKENIESSEKLIPIEKEKVAT